MKSKLLHLLMLAQLVTMVPMSGYGQNVFIIKSVDASIHGTSTLHDWKSTITKIECQCYFQTDGTSIKTIKDILVKIPVTGIKSKEGKLMDEKTFEAFKSDINPYITFTADSAQIKIDSSRAAMIKVTGKLAMAGITKPVGIQANGQLLPNGDLKISVAKKLTMTSFNMKPPTAILGTIKVGDEVEVIVDLVLTHAGANTAMSSKK
jgi:polyisoprenoid-binding protein YceI